VNGDTLPLRKPIHEIKRATTASTSKLVDPGEVGIIQHLRLQPDTPARSILNPPATPALTQLVLSYPAYPRDSRTTTARPETPRDQKHRREHLGREVRRRLSITRLTHEVAHHAGKVATVEHGESRTIARGDRREQLAIRPFLIQRHLKQ
jgi:hypothetical protein